MKIITVSANEVAIVTKRERLVNVLNEGRHFIGFGKEVSIVSMTRPMTIDDTWAAYLEEEQLRQMGSLINIADDEIGIELKNGLYSRVLTATKVFYWHTSVKYEVKTYNTSEIEVPNEIPVKYLTKAEVIQHLRVYTIESFQKGILYIDGKFVKYLDAGVYYYWKSPQVAIVKSVDMRTQSITVSGQEILTKDKAGIRINFSATYQVMDIQKAIVETKDVETQIYTELQLALREYIGSFTLDQLLDNKESVGNYITNAIVKQGELMGIKVISGGIKDIILPGDVKEIMNQVLLAQKKAQANGIMRQEETAATRSLLNTAKLMEDNSMLLKLKEMEYMEKIAEKIGEITVNGGSQVMDQLRTMILAK